MSAVAENNGVDILNPAKLALQVEALVFVAEQSISLEDIELSLEKAFEVAVPREMVLEALETIEKKYEADKYSFELRYLNDGYQFLSKSAYHNTISSYLNITSKRRLSTAALETLSIIAYKQPVTKSEIEQIRGVNCDYSVKKLLEKELIEMAGRSERPGRPLLYRTSEQFMDYFGLKTMSDLPQLKEVIPQHNQIGESEEAEQETPA